MGVIEINTHGSFGQKTAKFPALHHGHAAACARAMQWLSGVLLPESVGRDHDLHEQGHKPERGFTPSGPGHGFPEGKLNDDDEGEIRFVIGSEGNKVICDFGKPVTWVGMPPELARQMAQNLINHADDVERKA